MAKKKDEKDVLVVRDEKTGEISVVAGLNADGTPKRTPAKAENAQSFLQFDRHGDVLDNFFKNFFRQCKEPSRFGFYRIAADQAENLLEVMKQLLKDPEANKELLAPHKVDTSDYEKKVQEEMAAQQTEKQEPQKQENMEQRKEQQQDKSEQMQGKRGYQPIDESKINWQELEDRWGVKRDNLEKSGDLTKMLNYGKSDLVKVKPTFGGESFELDARLSFKKDGEGNISLVPHFIRKEQKLDEYKEHKFSDNDRKNLRETGNLGRVVDIVDRETGEIIPSYISIDRKTNEITDIPASRVRIPERIGKTEITTQERDMLRAGLPVRDKLIERNDGRKFVTTLQVNVEQRGVEFVPGTGKSPRTAQTQETKGDTSKSQAQGGENAAQTKKEQRRNTWTNEDGSIRPISKWSGVSFTDQQKADYVAGSTAEMSDLVRGALISIPKHQYESSAALGLTKMQTYLYVIIPQAVRRLIPLSINLITRMIKTTSLILMIGVVEVLKVAQQIIEANRMSSPNAAFGIYLTVFLLYFIACWPISMLAKYLERKWR